VFRETLEAAIIVSVLLGLAEQIVHEDPSRFGHSEPVETVDSSSKEGTASTSNAATELPEDQRAVHHRRLIRKLRIQASPIHHWDNVH
jgi:high-affinity iron transporter